MILSLISIKVDLRQIRVDPVLPVKQEVGANLVLALLLQFADLWNAGVFPELELVKVFLSSSC